MNALPHNKRLPARTAFPVNCNLAMSSNSLGRGSRSTGPSKPNLRFFGGMPQTQSKQNAQQDELPNLVRDPKPAKDKLGPIKRA